MKNKIILTFLALMTLSINISSAAVFKSDAETKRIPAGTKFTIKLLEPLSTKNNQMGDYFSAMLINATKTSTNVILPAGSVMRGSIEKVVKNKRFSRGAILYLDFDHIVTPDGKQLPIDMFLCGNININYDGGVYINKGYGEAVQENVEKCFDILTDFTENGIDLGDSYLGGFGKIFTVPVYAFGGAVGGVSYFVGDSIADMFKKGKNVEFDQDTILNVMLVHPIDVPIN